MCALIFRGFLTLCALIMIDCQGMPSQVVIIRHAEKYLDGSLAGQLTPQGLRRAGALASFFTELDPGTTNVPLFSNGLPTVLFASRPVADGSNNTTRCIQTISTTAAALGLPIHSGFGYGQESELARFILENPRYEGKNVLICWHHPTIGALIQALGYPFNLNPYPETRFDLVWLLNFPVPANPQPLVPILQELLYGDLGTFP